MLKATYNPRQFQQRWEIDYFCLLNAENKVQCLICNTVFSSMRCFNISRHYNKNHAKDYAHYNGNNRILILNNLKLQQRSMKNVNNPSFNKTLQQQCLAASYAVCLEIARAKKSFSEGGFVKKCAIEMAKAFHNTDAVESFEQVSLSCRTVARRIEKIDVDITQKLKNLLQSSRYFSLCLDESTDISDISQLCIFVRCIQNDFSIHEELMSLVALHDTTKGIDIFNAVLEHVNSFCSGFEKCTAVVTDGAKAMVGTENGFCGQLRKHQIYCPMFHCIIHQEVLCTKILKMTPAMKVVVKVTNLIRGGNRSLTHRKFKLFLQEVNATHNDLPLHCEVRWLSAGKCLNHFFALRKEIPVFLQNHIKNTAELQQKFEDPKFMSQLAFLVDITQHLNELNLKLQLQKQTISNLIHHINDFRNRLNLFKIELMKDELIHFPSCEDLKKEYPFITFADFSVSISNVISEFNSRFADFDNLKNDILLFNNPLSLAIEQQRIEYRMELCDLQADPFLLGRTESGLEFFKILPETTYPKLRDFGLKMGSMFGSTYRCESAFSTMKLIKNKNRSSMTDNALSHLIRIAISEIPVDISTLVDRAIKQSTSHLTLG